MTLDPHPSADPAGLVRAGYDRLGEAFQPAALEPAAAIRDVWLPRFAAALPAGARVLDLGCGPGDTAARLASRFRVTGVDFSAVQIERARRAAPAAGFVIADMREFELVPGAWDGIVMLYSIIHVPLDDQPALLERIAAGLSPGGWLLMTAGQTAWTGSETDWLGVPGVTMHWSHGAADDYHRWTTAAGLEVRERAFIPEGRGGHGLLLARRPD